MGGSKPDVKEIFGKAIEIDSAADRVIWLDGACGNNAELRAEVEQLLAAFNQTDDFMQKPAVAVSPPPMTDAVSGSPSLPPRYQAIAEIARGGMGVVWRVIDHQFDRPLAVKLMLSTKVDTQTVARFEREAQITGNLQHPGIPPVVDHGVLENKLPFFSMKLVEGQTLAELLKKRVPELSDLPRFLNIFEQVCQPVGYANSQAVIHRDLKPHNVMVGAFGEVQVMDWGMAKRMGDQETEFDPESSTIDLFHNDDDGAIDTKEFGEEVTLTRAGQVLGTLAYMPPEQARGELDRIDSRADVFSLGAILCKILTGDPPFMGRDRMQVYQRVIAGELAEAYSRIERSGVDQDLISLCRSCLAADPDDRPADGLQVAEHVREYQETMRAKMQQERADRVAAEVRVKEERKRRLVMLVSAVATIFLLIGIGGMAWWIQKSKITERTAAIIRAEHATEDIEKAITRSAELRELFQFDAAETLLEQAERRLESLMEPAPMVARVNQANADLNLTKSLDEISLRSSVWTNEGFDRKFAIGRDGSYAQAFRDYGIAIFNDDSPEKLGKRVSESEVAGSLVAALDLWASYDPAFRARLGKIANAADRDPFRGRLRDQDDLDTRTLKEWGDQDNLSHPPATFRMFFARLLRFEQRALSESESELLKNAHNVLVRAAVQHPANFWLQYNAGQIFIEKQPEDAIGFYRAAIAIRPRNAAAYHNLAVSLSKLGRDDEAELAERRAIELDPDHSLALRGLAIVLSESGRKEQAEDYFARAMDVNQNDFGTLIALGNMLKDQGRYDEAEAAISKAIKINPDNAPAHWVLGNVLDQAERIGDAEKAYQKAIEVDPKFAEAYCSLGILMIWKKNQIDEGLKLLKHGHKMGTSQGDGRLSKAKLMATAGRLIAAAEKLKTDVEQRWLEIETGKRPADSKEAIAFARHAQFQKHDYQVARRLYEIGLGEDEINPKDRLQHEYNAGCVALLCAADNIDPQDAARLRSQALNWYRDCLSNCERMIVTPENRSDVIGLLKHWQTDKDLESVRGSQIDQLPDDERQGWRDLWLKIAEIIDGNEKNLF